MTKQQLDLSKLPKEKETQKLSEICFESLDELKATNIVAINVKDVSNVTDVMFVASGNSNRHVKSIADNLIENMKKNGKELLGVEGMEDCQWVLIDMGDVLAHVMQEQARDFYELEKLWEDDEQDFDVNESTSTD